MSDYLVAPGWGIDGVTSFTICSNSPWPIEKGSISYQGQLVQAAKALNMPSLPAKITQVHGKVVVNADSLAEATDADGTYTSTNGVVCAVATADCIPVLVADKACKFVAALHAGWRGVLEGIIYSGLSKDVCNVGMSNLNVWLGPGIRKDSFEVGEDVYNLFMGSNTTNFASKNAFSKKDAGDKYLLDLYAVVKNQLTSIGIHPNHIFDSNLCTYSNPERFCSYRRSRGSDQRRLMSCIWLDKTERL